MAGYTNPLEMPPRFHYPLITLPVHLKAEGFRPVWEKRTDQGGGK